MGLSSRLLRLPRPQKFLYTMSLSTGASLITLSLLLNKLSGLYGILALFSGYHLSPFQLSMYIYSILALGIAVYLIPHIRSQSPLHCVVLAWFYVLDSLINAAYTAAFVVTWFLVLAQHSQGNNPSDTNAPGAGTIDDTAGFTSPEFNVSSVEISSPGGVNTTPSSSPAGTNSNSNLLTTESMNSIGIILALWTIRLYFCVIMLAFARMVLRQHIIQSSQSKASTTDYTAASSNSELAENPFTEMPGYKGKLGRALISFAPRYWLGSDEDDAWMSGMGGKFRRSTETGIGQGIPLGKVESGPAERERRRRSGTGPPEPAADLVKGSPTLNVPVVNL